tara:strand:+ start:675 stop:875 length:201 start_codon:yes stop_codon:yes gene_type:complete
MNKSFRIIRVVKNNGVPVAYTVRIAGLKFPRGRRDFYFPKDKSTETAIEMALNDYANYIKGEASGS